MNKEKYYITMNSNNTNLKTIYNLIIIALLLITAILSFRMNQVIKSTIQTEMRDYKHTEWVKSARIAANQADTLQLK